MRETRKVVVDGEEYEVIIDREKDRFVATVRDRKFQIEIPEFQSQTPRKDRSTSKKSKGGTISSNIPGKVISIHVSAKEIVEEGQVCLILEAMKMQNEIVSPISGIVTQINCTAGDSINANVPLMVIEPAEDKETKG